MDTQNGKQTGGGAAKKLLMPLVATAVSAAATYAGKRAPRLLEEKVMPKLRDATSGTEDLASGLAERAKSVVGRGDDGEDDNGGGDDNGETSRTSGSRRTFSNDELEQRRSARAEQRSSRRKAARGSKS
jgi:hypothetical protein